VENHVTINYKNTKNIHGLFEISGKLPSSLGLRPFRCIFFVLKKDAAAIDASDIPAGQIHYRSPNRQSALQEPVCWVRRTAG
jgi:hypothetical protein